MKDKHVQVSGSDQPRCACLARRERVGGVGDQVSRAHTDYLHALNTNQVNKAGVIELVYKISV